MFNDPTFLIGTEITVYLDQVRRAKRQAPDTCQHCSGVGEVHAFVGRQLAVDDCLACKGTGLQRTVRVALSA